MRLPTTHDQEQHYRLTPEQEQELPGRVRAVLAAHVGSENAITAEKIARVELKIHDPDGRKTRVAIALLVDQKEPICADESGFWWCASLEEGITYHDDLVHREDAIRKRRMKFREAVKRCFGWDPDQPRLL
jgi:hypothetical protein